MVRPWMPPAAWASSQRIRTPLTAETPRMAVGPERSLWLPMTISESVMPCTGGASLELSGAPDSSGPAQAVIRIATVMRTILGSMLSPGLDLIQRRCR